ncbi:MAG: cyclase family protein [Gemmataceae bacterium]|nr:cyclase family protein [Gemmataceae bacterium]MDW8266554.1 cyclase family protein [Gemmataceae bacterium]
MLIDITPRITEQLAVWPGAPPWRRQPLMDMARGDPFTVAAFSSTAHIGAHVDAPCHYDPAGRPIDAQPLELYVGPCQVLRPAARPGMVLRPGDLPEPITAERVLIATGTFPDWTEFRTDFAALSPELLDWLHERGVRLVGIDTPSVDPFAAADLPVHRRCAVHDIAILEGLVLHGVPEGRYELIALPLKLGDFDGSPVRAVLRELR